VRINDTTKGQLVGSNVTGGRFWFTYDTSTYGSPSDSRVTNSSSYMNFTFNPNCTPTRYQVSDVQNGRQG